MNKQEVVKQIKELIEEKERLLEGDELDAVFEYDIEVLKNVLKAIEEKPQGVLGGNNGFKILRFESCWSDKR